jgi:predicted nuclease of predicted toxin-antitoxin system
MRFHLVENVDCAIAQALRQRVIDVTAAAEAGLLGATDERHIEFAAGSGRVIYTLDADFIRLHHSGAPHSGIIYSPPGRTTGAVVRHLCLIEFL